MANEKLIRASDARKAILKEDPKLAYCIANIPGVDAVEVRYGRWHEKILVGGFAEEWGSVCSVCGCTVSDRSGLGEYQGSNQKMNYCPNCGADMRGKKDGK